MAAVAADSTSTETSRVLLLTDRWLRPAEWRRLSLELERPKHGRLESFLTAPPAAALLEPSAASEEETALCWQLHDLLGVPVVALAPGAAAADVVALLDRGADDVVTDEIEPSLLAARVAAILRRTPRPAARRLPATVAWGDVQVDLLRRTVVRAGEVQTLSRTEFSLFLALLRCGGRTCSQRELITRVWGVESAAAAHYLRLYIRYLREKLEDNPRHPKRVLTVWGTGYRLNLTDATQLAEYAAAPAPLPAVAQRIAFVG